MAPFKGNKRSTGPARSRNREMPHGWGSITGGLGGLGAAAAGPPKGISAPPAPAAYDGTAAAAASSNPLFEAIYNNSISGAGTDYNNTIAGLQLGEDNVGRDFGFQLARGADGSVDVGASLAHVDPNNPFSKMSLLSRSYQQEQSSNMNSYAGQGQLNSGAYQRMKANAQFGNTNNLDSLRKGFGDAINQSSLGRKGAFDMKTQAGASAATSRLQNYLGG